MEATTEVSTRPQELVLVEKEPVRLRIAIEALWEIESIANQLVAWAQNIDAADLWVRGAAVRIESLSCVGMGALGDDLHKTDELAATLRDGS